jgi:hypothetical protein
VFGAWLRHSTPTFTGIGGYLGRDASLRRQSGLRGSHAIRRVPHHAVFDGQAGAGTCPRRWQCRVQVLLTASTLYSGVRNARWSGREERPLELARHAPATRDPASASTLATRLKPRPLPDSGGARFNLCDWATLRAGLERRHRRRRTSAEGGRARLSGRPFLSGAAGPTPCRSAIYICSVACPHGVRTESCIRRELRDSDSSECATIAFVVQLTGCVAIA